MMCWGLDEPAPPDLLEVPAVDPLIADKDQVPAAHVEHAGLPEILKLEGWPE